MMAHIKQNKRRGTIAGRFVYGLISANRARLCLLRIITLIALTSCCTSLLDYMLPSPIFCPFEAGCDEVIHSVYGSLLGIPLPIVGMLAFGAFYCLTFLPDSLTDKLLGPAAIIAGLCGLGLILIQVFVIEQICPLCLITDIAALLLAVIQLAIAPVVKIPVSSPRLRRAPWIIAAILAVGGPFLWPLVAPIPPIPGQVKAHWVPGGITVVEIIDFDCHYCRENHAVVSKVLEEEASQVDFVMLVRPREESPNSRHAARAYMCALRQSKDFTMAKGLFAADDLSAEACEQVAEAFNLDISQYRKDVIDPSVDEQIEQITGWFNNSHIPGLPVVWVQDQRLLGLQTVASLRAALHRVQRDYPDGYQQNVFDN